MTNTLIIAALCVVTIVGDIITWRATKHQADRASGYAQLAEAYRDEAAEMLAEADGAQS